MISRLHKCIFVHIPKTGGTSIESVIWPDIKRRTPSDLYMGLVDRYTNKYQTGGLQHLFARHIRTEVGSELFSECFKFTIVRNPWDKAVSQFAYMAQREDLRTFIGMSPNDSFKRYLELICRKSHVQWEPQVNFIRDQDGTLLVDHIGRFETFTESVSHILAKVGLQSVTIPHEKKGARRAYQEYYDSESIQLLAEFYAEDINTFGYTFDR